MLRLQSRTPSSVFCFRFLLLKSLWFSPAGAQHVFGLRGYSSHFAVPLSSGCLCTVPSSCGIVFSTRLLENPPVREFRCSGESTHQILNSIAISFRALGPFNMRENCSLDLTVFCSRRLTLDKVFSGCKAHWEPSPSLPGSGRHVGLVDDQFCPTEDH